MSIDSYVFKECATLSQVPISSSMEKIDEYAFSDSSLTQTSIPD